MNRDRCSCLQRPKYLSFRRLIALEYFKIVTKSVVLKLMSLCWSSLLRYFKYSLLKYCDALLLLLWTSLELSASVRKQQMQLTGAWNKPIVSGHVCDNEIRVQMFFFRFWLVANRISVKCSTAVCRHKTDVNPRDKDKCGFSRCVAVFVAVRFLRCCVIVCAAACWSVASLIRNCLRSVIVCVCQKPKNNI